MTVAAAPKLVSLVPLTLPTVQLGRDATYSKAIIYMDGIDYCAIDLNRIL